MILLVFSFTLLNAEGKKKKHVEVSLLTRNSIVKPGDTLHIASVFKIEKDWHIYWLNPGNSGMETKINPVLPKGYKALGLIFSAPERIIEEELVTFGYEKEAVIITTIYVPKDAKPGKQKIKLEHNWLECKEVCLPGKSDLTVEFEIAQYSSPQSKEWLAMYSKHGEKFPSVTPKWQFGAKLQGEKLLFDIKCKDNSCAKTDNFEIFPVYPGFFKYYKTKIEKNGSSLSAVLELDEFREKDPKRFKALLFAPKGWSGGKVSKAFFIDVPVK